MNAKKNIPDCRNTHWDNLPETLSAVFLMSPVAPWPKKFIYMKEHEDWFRTLMSYEPRGNDYMSCTLVTEPCTPGTDVGVLYFETSGWLQCADTIPSVFP